MVPLIENDDKISFNKSLKLIKLIKGASFNFQACNSAFVKFCVIVRQDQAKPKT